MWVKLCDYYAGYYKTLNRDLLLTAAMFHDIGKMQELSRFPENDYTDDGQLLGHIMIGTEMISERIRQIPDFPPRLASELKHCILAHHGELEYGSPKKPALLEALALNFADNTDAKMETMIEALAAGGTNKAGWATTAFRNQHQKDNGVRKVEKNQEFTVIIEDMSEDGSGIGKLDGYIWFIKDTVIGDQVRAKAMKMKKSYGFARLMEVITSSAFRTEPRCPAARPAGAASFRP